MHYEKALLDTIEVTIGSGSEETLRGVVGGRCALPEIFLENDVDLIDSG